MDDSENNPALENASATGVDETERPAKVAPLTQLTALAVRMPDGADTGGWQAEMALATAPVASVRCPIAENIHWIDPDAAVNRLIGCRQEQVVRQVKTYFCLYKSADGSQCGKESRKRGNAAGRE